jgi:hypothetical protein
VLLIIKAAAASNAVLAPLPLAAGCLLPLLLPVALALWLLLLQSLCRCFDNKPMFTFCDAWRALTF